MLKAIIWLAGTLVLALPATAAPPMTPAVTNSVVLACQLAGNLMEVRRAEHQPIDFSLKAKALIEERRCVLMPRDMLVWIETIRPGVPIVCVYADRLDKSCGWVSIDYLSPLEALP